MTRAGMTADKAVDFATFEDLLHRSGFDESRLVTEPSGTVVMTAPAEDVESSVEQLPVLLGDTAPDLALKDPLGRGGMGQVRRAEQLSLLRDVAVKLAVPGGASRHDAADGLLREGRATGALEHPNIVPVHALGRSHDGEVLLVMKRIEGTAWSTLLRDRTSVASDLERHLRIFMDVCRAVHFAHSRGVLHRDLKPENVMVGPFGEVYVLDWGLAVCVGERTIPGVRRASDVTTVAGTPAFMAPEMALLGEPLDERTDVYLLGGVLHVILTGKAPHDGQSVREMLYRAHVAEPPVFPEGTPRELAELCARALARDPAARPPSAEALRAAVDDHLHHASALELCDDARGKLAELLRMHEEAREDDLAAHRAYSAARFGFEAALRAWPSSPEALQGLHAVITSMAEYELRRRHVDAAAVLVEELPAPPADLRARLDKVRADLAEAERKKAHAEKLARDVDASVGQRRRAAFILASGLVWLAFDLVIGALSRAGAHDPSYPVIIGGHVFVFVGFTALTIRFGSLDERRAGRHLTGLARMAVGSATGVWIGCWWVDAPMHLAFGLGQLCLAGAIWTGGSFFDRRLRWIARVAFASCSLFMVAPPEYAFEVNGISVALMMAWVAWFWMREPVQTEAA